MSEKVRLNKALADAGLCSRRKADELIQAGQVLVNAEPAQSGLKVDPLRDTITVAGRVVSFAARNERPVYLMLHKPVHVVSTASDPQGRTTVLNLLPPEYNTTRIYPVGRLDYFSEGLLLLTNDGELTQGLTHPRHHIPRIYEVRLRQKPEHAQLATMRGGMRLAEGEQLAPVKVEVAHDARTLRMTLHQGVNRQIRRMCRDLNLTILSLRRIALGPLSLGNLEKGKCRALRDDEVAALKKAVGQV